MMKKDENMFAEERKQKIVDLVNRETKTTVDFLCETFSVSPATIRNDLRDLEGSGLLKRTHGGAISNRQVTYEPNFGQKEIENKLAKEAIGRFATQYIQRGDSIIIDTGTTTYEMAKQLVGCEDLTVVTNDLQIAAFLERNSNAVIIMPGGTIRRHYHYVSGSTVTDTIRKLNVDKAFIAANGVSIKRGLTSPNMDTAVIKSEFIGAADEVIVLADSSKVEQNKFVKFADFANIDLMITDEAVDPAFVEEAKKVGVDVQIAYQSEI